MARRGEVDHDGAESGSKPEREKRSKRKSDGSKEGGRSKGNHGRSRQAEKFVDSRKCGKRQSRKERKNVCFSKKILEKKCFKFF